MKCTACKKDGRKICFFHEYVMEDMKQILVMRLCRGCINKLIRNLLDSTSTQITSDRIALQFGVEKKGNYARKIYSN